MIVATTAAALACLLVAVAAPWLGRRLPPATATKLLVPAAWLTAACTVFVLGVLAFTWIGQVPAIAVHGPWSARRLDAADPLPDQLGALSLLLLAGAAMWAVRTTARRARALASVYRTARTAPPGSPVVVLDDPRPDAFTTPAPAARIVVTTALLSALTEDEQRVVLTHERSHLEHHHIWWTLTIDLAAAVNPLLRPTAQVVNQAVERWADEDAATAVGDRRLVARTIARAALIQHDASRQTAAAAATGGDVPRRVRAMLDHPPRRQPLAALALAALLSAATLGTCAVERTGERLFEHAARPTVHSQHAAAMQNTPTRHTAESPAAAGDAGDHVRPLLTRRPTTSPIYSL